MVELAGGLEPGNYKYKHLLGVNAGFDQVFAAWPLCAGDTSHDKGVIRPSDWARLPGCRQPPTSRFPPPQILGTFR